MLETQLEKILEIFFCPIERLTKNLLCLFLGEVHIPEILFLDLVPSLYKNRSVILGYSRFFLEWIEIFEEFILAFGEGIVH